MAKYFFTAEKLKQYGLLGEKSDCFFNEIGHYEELLKGLRIIVLLRAGKIKLKEDVEKIKEFFETEKNIYQFLDKPHSNLLFDIVINQLVYDECRYIYEWLPALHQIVSSFKNLSWQYVFRFALDGLVKMRQNYNNEFFLQGSVVSNTVEGFSSKKLQERIKVY